MNAREKFFYTFCQSPIGQLTLQTCASGLSGIWLERQTTQPENLGTRTDEHPVLRQTIAELEEYFAGERKVFGVSLASRGTEFQHQVWRALKRIPFGETRSYAQLAAEIKNPKAVRAVGLANGKNPISIIVPCHRVIGKNGALTGYAGGLQVKSWLLKHEGVG